MYGYWHSVRKGHPSSPLAQMTLSQGTSVRFVFLSFVGSTFVASRRPLRAGSAMQDGFVPLLLLLRCPLGESLW